MASRWLPSLVALEIKAARRIRAMGIRHRPVSALIGSIRRECLDHVVVLGERHLQPRSRIVPKIHNEARTHLSLQKDAPVRRDVCRTGRVRSSPILGGDTINMFEFEFPTGARAAHRMQAQENVSNASRLSLTRFIVPLLTHETGEPAFSIGLRVCCRAGTTLRLAVSDRESGSS
jgi:hypothetical protein